MNASDTDEEYLDDPIRLYDFEQIRFGCHTLRVKDSDNIDKTASYDERISLPNQEDVFILPGTFFDIERNIELLEKCRPLSIQIVDCAKYPLYYKSKSIIKHDSTFEKNNAFDKVFEVQQDKFLDESLSEHNIDDIQFQFRCTKNTVNYSPKVIFNENEENFKGNKIFSTMNTRTCQNLKLQEISSDNSHIDLKKNRGLIGLKIIRKDRLEDQLEGNNSALEESIFPENANSSKNEMELACHRSLIANKNTILHEQGNLFKHDQEIYFKENNTKEKINDKKIPKLKFTSCKVTNIINTKFGHKSDDIKETPNLDINFDKNECIQSKKIIQETRQTLIANSVKHHNNPIEVKEVRSKSPIFHCTSKKNGHHTTNTKEKFFQSPKMYTEQLYNSNILNENFKGNLKYFDKSPKKQNNLEKSRQRQEKYQKIAMEFQSNITPKHINNHLSFNECQMREVENNLPYVAKSIDKESVLLNQQGQDVFKEPFRLNNVVRKLNKINITHENKNNKKKISNVNLKNQMNCFTNSFKKVMKSKNEVICGEIHTNANNNMPLTGHQKTLVKAIPTVLQKHNINDNITNNYCSLGASNENLMQSNKNAYISTSQIQFLPPLGSIKAVRHQIPHSHFRIPPVSDILLSSLRNRDPHSIRRKNVAKNKHIINLFRPLDKYVLGLSKPLELPLADKSDDSNANSFNKIVEGPDVITKINSKPLADVEEIKEIKRDALNVLKINHNEGSKRIKPTKGYSAPILPIPTFELFFAEIAASNGQDVSENKDIQEDKNVSHLERPPKSSELSAPLKKRKLVRT